MTTAVRENRYYQLTERGNLIDYLADLVRRYRAMHYNVPPKYVMLGTNEWASVEQSSRIEFIPNPLGLLMPTLDGVQILKVAHSEFIDVV